jgi:hypothetical protein
MDKERLQRLSDPVIDVYLDIEYELLMNIAKRLKKHHTLLTEDDIESWQMASLNEVESLSTENLQTIAEYSNKTADEVRKQLNKAGYDSIRDNEEILQQGVRTGRLDDAPPVMESAALLSILEAYERQALNTFNLVNTTMLDQSRQAYVDILNQTAGQVMSGNVTGQQALRSTISQWSEGGVPALVDRAGKRWSPEAYTSMIFRSTSNSVANDMQNARMDEYDVDLVEISAHDGARPLCAPYQGRVFSRSGNDPDYPALSDTTIGEPAGLFGVNCGHRQYPFIKGISKKTYEPKDDAENERIYEESQKQRYLERQIRYAKREENMLAEIGDREGAERAHRKMLDRQANQREFIKRTGRTRRYDRERLH